MTAAPQPTLFSGTDWFDARAHRKHIRAQTALLQRCVAKGLRLDEELRRVGWTYDDLRYESADDSSIAELARDVRLDSLKVKSNGIPLVSFFSGAGGMDLGFEAAGFNSLAAVEHNPLFCSTLRENRSRWNVIGPPDHAGDVSDTESIVSAVRGVIGSRKIFDGVFIGGPPCQPFSIAANQRFSKSGGNFKRVGFSHEKNGNLLLDYLEIVKAFKPRVFVIENVPGLMSIDGGEQLRRAVADITMAGYSVFPPTIVNVSDYGVPQSRKRVFVVGTLGESPFDFPAKRAIKAACGPVLACAIGKAKNHVTREHSAESVLRYMKLNSGGRDQLGRVDRLDPRVPAKTIIAGGANGGGRSHLHPHVPRTLSVRESARLQTFPDDYVFLGPSARQFTQVGNAVPPVFAALLAHGIALSVFGKSSRKK